MDPIDFKIKILQAAALVMAVAFTMCHCVLYLIGYGCSLYNVPLCAVSDWLWL
jgi:hypothetical protein